MFAVYRCVAVRQRGNLGFVFTLVNSIIVTFIFIWSLHVIVAVDDFEYIWMELTIQKNIYHTMH